MQLENDTFLRALMRQPTSYTPLWLMRQAGRYLPEYCATRAKAGSFMNLAKSPTLASEVTLQPVERFNLDAAILFSDILTVPDAMGLGLSFAAGEGPRFAKPVQSEAAVKELFVPDPDKELRYVMDAVREIRKNLKGRVPLIGFSGSPFTLACYMVEGGSSSEFRTVKTMLYKNPALLHRILEINAQSVTAYLNAQIEAGAQAVMIFDTWGGALAHPAFEEFSLRYTKKVLDGLIKEHDGAHVPSIVFTKGGAPWVQSIAASGADAVGLDWTVSLGKVRAAVNDKVALQGNMDPMVLFSGEEGIRREARRVIEDFGAVGAGGHIFNLGHGINKDTPPESIAVLVDEVHSYSRKFHS
jgi:uroporphyrinogen decarboxylase